MQKMANLIDAADRKLTRAEKIAVEKYHSAKKYAQKKMREYEAAKLKYNKFQQQAKLKRLFTGK